MHYFLYIWPHYSGSQLDVLFSLHAQIKIHREQKNGGHFKNISTCIFSESECISFEIRLYIPKSTVHNELGLVQIMTQFIHTYLGP